MKDILAKAAAWVKGNQRLVTVILYALSVLAAILVGILAIKQPAVTVCIVLVIEVLIAALMRGVELWIHGIVMAAEIVAAILIARVPLMIVCVVIYAVTVLAFGVLHRGKE